MAKDKDFTVSQRFHNRYAELLDQTVTVTLENGRTVTGIFADEIYEDASVLISIPSGNAVEAIRIAEIRQMEPADAPETPDTAMPPGREHSTEAPPSTGIAPAPTDKGILTETLAAEVTEALAHILARTPPHDAPAAEEQKHGGFTEMTDIMTIDGGVCAAKGFSASGVHCGIRKNRSKRDLALIYSAVPANAAAVYTTNLVKGAPLTVTRQHLADGRAQAVICNSGNANTCNANGIEIAEQTCGLLGQALGISANDVVVASTGVIGQPLDITPIQAGIPALVQGLGPHSEQAADGIMTTDTRKKEIAVSFHIGGKECRIGGIAKGSGMIHPNMATMLVFITTDCAISSAMLQKALSTDIAGTFHMVSVDGDTSTNDMVTVLANGMAKNPEITAEGADFDCFMKALNTVTVHLCRCIAADGEGATKLLECKVSGAPDLATARVVAKSVICSSLTKSAMFGADANWGRVLCAIGYSGADVDVNRIDVAFRSAKGTVAVCRGGSGVEFSEAQAKEILLESEIEILVELHAGSAASTAWGCDLTYDYVKINGDYRT